MLILVNYRCSRTKMKRSCRLLCSNDLHSCALTADCTLFPMEARINWSFMPDKKSVRSTNWINNTTKRKRHNADRGRSQQKRKKKRIINNVCVYNIWHNLSRLGVFNMTVLCHPLYFPIHFFSSCICTSAAPEMSALIINCIFHTIFEFIFYHIIFICCNSTSNCWQDEQY